MTVRDILTYPDPRLRTLAKPVEQVDDTIKTLIEDMIETMYAADGIGLAASQVDEHVQLVVMDLSKERDAPRVFINPKITVLDEEKLAFEEGCLSVPGIYDEVERPREIKIEALDREGNPFTEVASGLLAVCIQHEMDHLNGKLFVDYLSKLKQDRARTKVTKLVKAQKA